MKRFHSVSFFYSFRLLSDTMMMSDYLQPIDWSSADPAAQSEAPMLSCEVRITRVRSPAVLTENTE